MQNSIIKKIVVEFENEFSTFEEYLLSPVRFAEFKHFLAKYRGMPETEKQHSYDREQSSNQTAENIINFFINLFSKNGLADAEENEINFILSEVEKIVNLTLYYWFGLNDRNYQFRTLIHFYDIDGIGSVFLTKNKHDFAVSLSEDGLRFGLSDSAHEPKCMPVSKVCGLSSFHEHSNERELFARIRTIQREICLLLDDWEHLNSILAVEYGRTYQDFQQSHTKKTEQAFEQAAIKMNARRDTLAQWCLESFCDFQEWITKFMSYKNFSEDIYSELDAASGVLLSGIQKIFLPASVSRHRYCYDVLPFLERFAKARIQFKEEDISSHLLLQVVHSSRGKEFNTQLLKCIDQKPYEWILAFDPSSAIKAFSWCYSKEHHLLLCCIYAICFFKKIAPNFIDAHHLSDIATSIQMPETFPQDIYDRVVHQNKCDVSEEGFQKLFLILNDYIDKNVKLTKNTEELCQFIRSSLQLKKVV